MVVDIPELTLDPFPGQPKLLQGVTVIALETVFPEGSQAQLFTEIGAHCPAKVLVKPLHGRFRIAHQLAIIDTVILVSTKLVPKPKKVLKPSYRQPRIRLCFRTILAQVRGMRLPCRPKDAHMRGHRFDRVPHDGNEFRIREGVQE